MKSTPNQAVAASGVGGALGVIAVWLIPYLFDIRIGPEEASLLTAAFGTVLAALVRYLPKPENRA